MKKEEPWSDNYLGPSTKCKICTKSFSSRGDFTEHLALDHFRPQLEQALGRQPTCPSCCLYRSKDPAQLVVHYGARCRPFPVKQLYAEWLERNKAGHSSDVCSFCGHKGHSPSDLVVHIGERHIQEVLDSMGFRFLFLQSQTRANIPGAFPINYMHCHLCNKIDSPRRLAEHFLRRHQGQFLQSNQRFEAASKKSVICIFCHTCQPNRPALLSHFVQKHFKLQLLAECGAALDRRLACNTCSFASSNEDEVTLHYGIEHGRLDFFFRQEVLKRQSLGEMLVSGADLPPIGVADGDYKALLRSYGPQQELQLLSLLSDRNHPLYRNLLLFSQCMSNGQLSCNICGLQLPSEDLMVAHLGLRPHFKADILVRLEEAKSARMLACKLCDEILSDKKAFWEHQALVHFFDDLASEIPIQRGTLACSEQNCTFSSPQIASFVAHLGEAHCKVEPLYRRLQVTRQMLTCSLCQEMYRDLRELKLHLTVDHFKSELTSDAIMMRTEDGGFSCVGCGFQSSNFDRTVVHVGTIHNLVEELYRRRATGENGNLSCELCQWVTCRQAQFLNHITEVHFKQGLVSNSTIQHEGCLYYLCNLCNQYWDNPDIFLDHVGRGLGCNQSLPYYFFNVDSISNPLTQVPALLSTDAALDRFQRMTNLRGGEWMRSWITSGLGGLEDPCSAQLKMEYNVYSQSITVDFNTIVDPRCFKPLNTLTAGTLSCYFCDIAGTPYSQTDRLVFQVHLAEAHFREPLNRMFRSPERVPGWHCGLCRSQEEFRHEQQLHGHLAYNHDIIDGMYEAAMPCRVRPAPTQAEPDPPSAMMLSTLFPWLPMEAPKISVPALDKLVDHEKQDIQLEDEASCRLCSKVFFLEERSSEVNRHYIQKHFGDEFSHKYSSSLQGQGPYHCPLCQHSTIQQSGQPPEVHRNHLFLHLGQHHGLVREKILAGNLDNPLVTSSSGQKEFSQDTAADLSKPKLEADVDCGQFQCMECHEDFGSMERLTNHLVRSLHLNLSWAVQTNTSFGTGGIGQQFGLRTPCRWFKKLSVGFRCGICPMTKYKFTSLIEVFSHIMQQHRVEFARDYVLTTTSYRLCKVGNCYINLESSRSSEEKNLMELYHYLSHGPPILASLGVLGRSSSGSLLCSPCSLPLDSFTNFLSHQKSSHHDEILQLFRSFSSAKLTAAPSPTQCCICKVPDPSPEHLSKHSKALLAKIGILDDPDPKIPLITCRICKMPEKDSFSVIRHFIENHRSLFNFLTSEHRKQDQSLSNAPSSSDLRACRLCSENVATNEFDNHLYQSHYHSRVHSLLERYPLRCPFCSPGTVIVIPGVKALVEHCIEKHNLVQEYYKEECAKLDENSTLKKTLHVQPTGKEVILGNGQKIQVVRYVQPPEKDQLEKLSCKECGKALDSLFLLREHLSKHHFALDLMTEMHTRGFVMKHKETNENGNVTYVQTYGCPEEGCNYESPLKNDFVLHLAGVHDLLDVVLQKRGKTFLLPQGTLSIKQESGVVEAATTSPPTESCPMCKINLQRFDARQRTDHYFLHVEGKLAGWLQRKYPKRAHLNDCPICNGKFPERKTLLKHLGSEHGLFEQFMGSREPQQPSALTQPGFSDAFAKFLQGDANPLLSRAVTVEPTGPSSNRTMKTQGRPLKVTSSGDQCKICEKPFEENYTNGKVKSIPTLKNEIKHHYISHFRKQLERRYPSSFRGEPPFTCAKCGFVPKTASQYSSIQKQAILNHVATCQNELEQLIDQALQAKNQSQTKTFEEEKVEKEEESTTLTWRTANVCLVCGIGMDCFDNLQRGFHYADHFRKVLAQKYQKVLQVSALVIPCPFSGCQSTFTDISQQKESQRRKFFVHVGDHHDEFNTCLMPSMIAKVKDSSTTDYLNCKEKLAMQIWVHNSPCLICKEEIGVLTEEERINHYDAHFKQLDQVFGDKLQTHQKCFICSKHVTDEKSFKSHLVENHLKTNMEAHVNCVDGHYNCSFCNFSASNVNEVSTHLVTEEFALEIEILKFMQERKIVPNNLFSTSYRKVHVEVIEDEEETEVKDKIRKVGNVKASTSTTSLAQFVSQLKANPECNKCHERMSSFDELTKHLIVAHFAKEMKAEVKKNFSQTALRSTSTTILCGICDKRFKNQKDKLALHLGVGHGKVIRFYYESEIVNDANSREIPTEVIDLDEDQKEVSLGLVSFGETKSAKETREDFKELQRFLSRARENQRVFIQKGPCYQLDPDLPPCHECKKILQLSTLPQSGGTCCCFEGFRKLQYIDDPTKGVNQHKTRLSCIGYLDPLKDPKPSDSELWRPNSNEVTESLSEDIALLFLQKLGDIFANMVTDEKHMDDSYRKAGKQVIWKRPHPGVREMCDVCSTSIFNYHFTCGTCGFLVCIDCFNGRKRGTRYKTLGMMAKPYRTHKNRFNKNLDKNLWPMCAEKKNHELDLLLLTHMSPGRVPMEIVEEMHELRKTLGIKAGCKCCRKDDDLSSMKDSATMDDTSEADIDCLNVCVLCETSFAEVDHTCKTLHLANHLKEQLIPEKGTLCPDCDRDMASRDLLLAHQALAHSAVQKYFQKEYDASEAVRQACVSLQVDLTPACEICGCKFTMGVEEKRLHYIGHTEDILLSKISVCEPFKCIQCEFIALSRKGLMHHTAIVHKELDAVLDVAQEKDEESFRSWMELKNCVICNEVLPTTGESAKRLHYLGHFQTDLEARINSESQKILKKPAPYACQEPNCKYTTELTVKTFLCHMVTKHKKLDSIIEAAVENHLDKSSLVPVDQFYVSCAVCNTAFDEVSGKENVALGKGHYASHFKTHLEKEFGEVLKQETLPIACPFKSCKFTTEKVDSDQYGHHKKKILVHIGHDHQLFRKLAKKESIRGLGLQRNKAEKVARHSEREGTLQSRCLICENILEVTCQRKAEKMLREKMKEHLFDHLGHVLGRNVSFQEAIHSLLRSPLSQEDVNYRYFFIPIKTDSYVHKPLDTKEEDMNTVQMLSLLTEEIPVKVKTPRVSVENPDLNRITLANLMLLHQTENRWNCDFCTESFAHPNLAQFEWRLHMLEHFKDGVSFKVKAMELTKCEQCNLKDMNEASMIHHLAFIHNDIDLDVQRCISNWPKDLRDNIVKRVDNFLIKKGSQKRKNLDNSCETVAKRTKEDMDLTDCIGEEFQPSLEDESVLRTLFDQDHCGKSHQDGDGKEKPKSKDEEEWELVGSMDCELCGEKLFSPPDKREHLGLKHFTSEVIKELRTLSSDPICPHCDYKQLSPVDLLKHVVREHQMADKYLAEKVPHLRDPQKLRSGEAVLCLLCKKVVDLGEKVWHLLTHFAATQVVPLVGKEECSFSDCILEFPPTPLASLQCGPLAEHVGKSHRTEVISDFLTDQIRQWLGDELVDVMEQQAIGLLTGEVCILCLAWLDQTPEVHFSRHVQDNLGRDGLQCQLCEDSPIFGNLEQAAGHHISVHLDHRKIMDDITSVETLINIRKSLGVALVPPEARPPESKETKSPISSRSSSPEGWLTGGRRPPPSIWSQGRIPCEFSGCDGYQEGEYYGHLTKHFKAALSKDIKKERKAGASKLSCPRCIFEGTTEMELLEHFGSYHRRIDFYVSVARNPKLIDQMNSGPFELSTKKECGQCGYKTSKGQARVTEHQVVHMMRDLLKKLPNRQPYICPACFYESSTRISLVRHFCQHHRNRSIRGEEVEIEENFEEDDEAGDGTKLTMLQVCASYGVHQTQKLQTGQKSCVKPTKSKSLRESIEILLSSENSEEGEEDEEVEDHSVDAQLARWCKEVPGIIPGLANQQTNSNRQREPGLSTLSSRRVATMQESKLMAPNTPHAWLCEGRLLQLQDAIDPGNLPLFQQQWDRGQPVLISNSNERMNHRLWHPRAFAKDFGHIRSDLVNTLTGKTVPRQPLKWFWEGFENVSHRLLDAQGTPMLLKLKDWPPDGDIAEYMPKRFHDLVHDFPIQQYTLREGSVNLASYIPDFYLRPELGPKMYIAYGNALYSNKASTNLHLDMSDAVNLMVYVGIPGDSEKQENIKLVLSQIDEAGCDIIMRRRVRDEGQLPGAIWHIYHPGDTNKIRDLLNRVAIEKGRRLDPHDDPIHDQSTYLDAGLRMRLYAEYGVKGYAIIQCQGDTVFIPCGACHQVRNLHNCIKIAEDFVSPELANNCLHLTQVDMRGYFNHFWVISFLFRSSVI